MKDLSKIYLLAFLVFADIAAFAGPGGDTGDGDLGGGDPPPAPINSYLIIMIGFALLLGFYFLTKYRKQNN
jgi:LPXTG-motif cell wall-anchored protein